MGSPAVSLVLCTRNRAEQLKVCLEYVARQNPSCSWELVVVDNGSTDDTGKVLAEYAAKAPFPTQVLYEGRPGKSRGLNQIFKGWASGEWRLGLGATSQGKSKRL